MQCLTYPGHLAGSSPCRPLGRPGRTGPDCRVSCHRLAGVTGVASVPTRARITLLAKPGCHLCDDARTVIERVAADLDVGWEERDITASPADTRDYWDKIPVVFVDGVQVDFWWVNEARLRAALG
jgi:glutaredoxin